MSNLKKEVNNFINYLQNINIDEDENFKIFIKETLHKFLEKKEILKDETLKQCQICKNCQTCSMFGFPCINCANICYKNRLGEGYPLHIN